MIKKFLLLFLLIHIIEGGVRKFLRYDTECIFLNDEEYAARMIKGRCPPRTPTPPSITKKPIKKQNFSRLAKGSKKLLLKFASYAKTRSISYDLKNNISKSLVLMEGVFVKLKCPNPEHKMTPNITWYFNGKKITDELDWRISINKKGNLLVTPLLSKSDQGHFQCFLNDEWRGSVFIYVETIFEAVIRGYFNYLIGSIFSVLFSFFSILFYCLFPEIIEDFNIEKPLLIIKNVKTREYDYFK